MDYKILEIDPMFKSVWGDSRFLELTQRLKEKVNKMRDAILAEELQD